MTFVRDVERADIARAFAHLGTGQVENADPISAMRGFVDRYGDVEPRASEPSVTVRPVSVAGLSAEWIEPTHPSLPARIIHLHGGGWVAGGLESHRPMAARLAKLSGARVLLPAYRLAPEHPFPAAFEDALGLVRWALDDDPSPVCLIGDSAGGNLAAAVCQTLCAEGPSALAGLVLISPVLDASANPGRRGPETLAEDHAALAGVTSLYAPGLGDLSDPRISPLNAPAERLARFPPTLIQASSAEFLAWDARAFTDRLAEAGARVNLSLWPAMPHVWHAFLTLLPEAGAALAEAAAFIRGAVRPPS